MDTNSKRTPARQGRSFSGVTFEPLDPASPSRLSEHAAQSSAMARSFERAFSQRTLAVGHPSIVELYVQQLTAAVGHVGERRSPGNLGTSDARLLAGCRSYLPDDCACRPLPVGVPALGAYEPMLILGPGALGKTTACGQNPLFSDGDEVLRCRRSVGDGSLPGSGCRLLGAYALSFAPSRALCMMGGLYLRDWVSGASPYAGPVVGVVPTPRSYRDTLLSRHADERHSYKPSGLQAVAYVREVIRVCAAGGKPVYVLDSQDLSAWADSHMISI